MLLFVLVPFPSNIPFYFFGHAFGGACPRYIFLGIRTGIRAALELACFKLKPWALYLEIVLQCVVFLN